VFLMLSEGQWVREVVVLPIGCRPTGRSSQWRAAAASCELVPLRRSQWHEPRMRVTSTEV
jgi:hypothetical protein